AVVAAEQVSGGDVRPGGERPGLVDRAVHVHVLVERCVVGLHAFGEVAGDVVHVQLVVVVDAGRGRAAPFPPFVRSLAGGGDHGGEQDECDGGGTGADERADDAAPGVGHHDEVPAFAGRLHDRVRVVPEACLRVGHRQVHGDRVVPAVAELGFQQVSVVGGAAGSGAGCECRLGRHAL